MNNSQLLKGILEGCVLLVVSEKEVYGYEMVQKLKQLGFENIVGGTVYPILQKLEKKEYLSSRMKPSSEGPDRKYYAIRALGKEYMSNFANQWQELTNIGNNIITKQGGNSNGQQ